MTTHRYAIIHQDNSLDINTLADALSHLTNMDLPSDTMSIADLVISYSQNTHTHTLKLKINDSRAHDPWLVAIRLHPAMNKWYTLQPHKSQSMLRLECSMDLSVFCYHPRDKDFVVDEQSTDCINIIKAIACVLSKQSDKRLILEIPNKTVTVYHNGEYTKAYINTNLY